MITTNAILFKRAGASDNRLEVYTDATSGTVDTQITAVTSNGKFTAGTFSGVVCEYAIGVTGCQVSNTLNNATTKVFGGSRSVIWGVAPVAANNAEDIQPVVDTIALANGANNNVSIEHSYNKIIGPTGAFSITGLVLPSGNSAGYTVTFVNLTGQTLTLAHQSGSSALGNKLYNLSGGDEVLAGNSTVELTWDPGVNSWLTKFSDTGTTGTGNVNGPAVATDNAAARYDGVTGKILQDGPVTIGDTGNVAGVVDMAMTGALTGATGITTSGTLGANAITSTTTIAATGALSGSNFSGSSSGTNTGDQLLRAPVNSHVASIAQNLTRYVSLDTYGTAQADPSDAASALEEYAWIASYNGTIRNLFIRVSNEPLAGESFIVTVRRNGVDGVLTATIADVAKTASDTSNSVSFSAGDRLAWKVVTSALSNTFSGTIAAEIRAD